MVYSGMHYIKTHKKDTRLNTHPGLSVISAASDSHMNIQHYRVKEYTCISASMIRRTIHLLFNRK